MRRLTTEAYITLILVGCLLTVQAAGPAIGIVITKGSFRIDNSTVWGNGTLFDGTTIETGQASSDLQMNCGARLALAAESRGTVYRDRLVLERGAGRLTSHGAYHMEARGLGVLPAGPEAAAEVVLSGADRVQVAALRGLLRVTNHAGVVVANIAAGKALEFEPQAAGAAAPSHLVGTLEHRDHHYLLTDRIAAVTVELQGPRLGKEVGQCIEVTGKLAPAAQPFSPATQVIRVTQMKRCSKETAAALAGAAAAGVGAGAAAAGAGAASAGAGPGAAAAGAGAGAAPAGAGVAGMAVAAKAIIAGVAVAGVAAGTAVVLTGEEEEKKPLSP